MSLPTKEEIDRINLDRPGDGIYPQVKSKIEHVIAEEKKTTSALVDLILKDMIYDLSVANSLDEIGKVVTYLSQEQEIEAPEFKADILMTHFSRISKLKLSLDYANMVGLKDTALDAVLKAEVDRLWGDSNSALLRKLLAAKNSTTNASPIQTGVKEKSVHHEVASAIK